MSALARPAPPTPPAPLFRVAHRGMTYDYVVNPDNGHGCFSPPPSDAVLTAYYNGEFSRSAAPPTPESEFLPPLIKTMTGVRKIVEDTTGLRDFSFFDVGCGYGAGVWAMQQIGIEAYGHELNSAWVAEANPHCQNKLSDRPLDEAFHAVGHPVDVIFSAHVLEHLPDPMATLAIVRKHLSTRGMFYAFTPNALCERVVRAGTRRADPHMQFPMHLNYFNPLSMFDMLTAAGLVPVKITTPRELSGLVPDTLSNSELADYTLSCLLGGELCCVAIHPDNTTVARAPTLRDDIIAMMTMTGASAFFDPNVGR